MTTAEQFRAEIPAAEQWTYLNTAATSPTHAKVRAAMTAFEEDRARRGEHGWEDWMDAVEGVREVTAWFFEAKKEEVALVKNTSEGICTVASGFPWRRGDEVVTTDLEFPSNILPWRRLERRGVSVKVVASRNGVVREEDVERALTDRTRLLAVSYVTFASGQRLDVARLAKAAHDRGAHILVDAIQAAGAVDVSFREWDADYVACGGHKWLMAPFGTGTLVVRQEFVERLEPDYVGWFGLEDNEDYDPRNTRMAASARRFEIGNLNLGGFAGWRAALGTLTTVPDRQRLVLDLSARLGDKLRSAGLQPRTPASAAQRAGIVSVPVKNVEEAALALRKQRVLVSMREGMIRFSTHFWNTREEVIRAADILIAHEKGSGGPSGGPARGARGGGGARPRREAAAAAQKAEAAPPKPADAKKGRRRRRRRGGGSKKKGSS